MLVECADEKNSIDIGVVIIRELLRERNRSQGTHSLAISFFNFTLMTACDPTSRKSGWSTEKGYGRRRVDGKKRRQSIG